MNLGRPDRYARLDALAAEYALGTLPARARRRLERIARRDADVASVVEAWEQRLAILAEPVPAVTPPPHVWIGVQRRLGIESGDAAASAPGRHPREAPRWWERVGLWQGLAIASFALAIVFGAMLFAPQPERFAEPVIVVLVDQDAKPAMVATAERGGRYLTVRAVAPVTIAADRALELWMLPDGKDPQSLGLIPATGVGRVTLQAPADIALRGIPALAVSLEPAGGSPSGKPTGPVLYSGGIQRLY